ncbi:cobalt-zinc-cadmium resistance protein CzcA [Desulfosalsimonas propionicica]|uniref:Cobalt-zinc-cadmium resistance protein CzcA n=1 Tax=Desulfosalsimonas propionicica TaxID=332175 RepID=A0A7W0C9Z6_9BACT|nr:CusA/CzcA family heavy metal efflux RND transporter [Desulfosalsimonas propionicica]MBA2881895.1 cobalt-zinc-cadmium resistance protein CzcA [Desulfosalsimonas propionicica]
MIRNIIHTALANKLLVVISIVLVFGFGVYAYRSLPVDAFPDVSPSLVQVFTVTAGLAPEEVEKYVTYPIEAKMTGLPKVRAIRSVSNFGLSVVNIYFEDGTDIYFARQVAGEKLGEAREQIPEGFGDPQMGPIATGQGQILYYYLNDTTGTYSLTELRTFQDWIVKFNLQTVPGVTEVLGIGGHEKQFQVVVDPDALLRYKLSLQGVIEQIGKNNRNVGAQFLEQNGEQLIVRSEGLAEGLADLEKIVLKSAGGRPVYLADVADIKIGGAIRRGLQTRNGEAEIVAGMVIKLIGTNSSTVIARVQEKLAEIQNSLPEGVEIVPFYEQKTIVDASVNTVTTALVQGIGLVLVVVFVFMGGIRPSLIVSLAIPFSVLFTFIVMRVTGMSANLMTLGGVAIAIGMMVDGTIVMVENADRMLRRSDPDESVSHVVSRACREVGRPILFAISIIIIVFLPLFTLEGVEGKTFRPLAYTVSIAMLGAMIYSIFQTPALSALLLKRPGSKSSGPTAPAPKEPLVVRALLKPYRPLVGFFVRFRWLAVSLSVLLLVIGALIYPRLGQEFTPRLLEGDIMVNLTFAPSASISESKRNVMLLEKRFLAIPEVSEVVSRIGRGEVGAHSAPVNVSHMNVLLKPEFEWTDAKTQPDIEAKIREKLKGFPGVQANITQPIQLSVDELIGGVKAELAVKLFGNRIGTLKEKGDAIGAVLRDVAGAADVQVQQMTGAPQLIIRPDQEAAARYGINIADIQDVIRAAVGGVEAGQVFEGIRRFDIYVRYEASARSTPEAIENIIVQTPEGVRLPLSELATVKTVVGPRQILRENNQRYIAVQCNVVGRDIGSFVEEAQKRIAADIDLPAGYFINWGGQFELQQQANQRLAIVIPVTLALIALMLYMSFKTFSSTLLILLNIPLALVGGVVALWIGGQNLSVPASVGFIALFGIALENGMVLVTYINQLVREGVPVSAASIQGACLRLRPVLMTAATTALGLIPLLLSSGTGSEVQKPLAVVVIGGLVSSTFLTLLVLPSLYKWFAPRIETETNGN